MAVTYNLKGTTNSSFQIGKNGVVLTPADNTSATTVTFPNATGTVALTSDLTSYITASSTDTLTNKTLGATTISGHLTPSANVTYDLGTSSLRFRDIYLSGSTIDLGGAKLTNDGSDNLDIKDSSGNRKIIRASAIELVDSSGKKMKLERDATSGKLKQTRKNADDSDEGSTDTLDIVGDTSPQLGGDLDTNGNNITFGDNDIAYFGTGNDLSIYHDGSHSYIKDVGTGNLWIGSNGEYTALGNSTASEFYIKASNNGAVELYYDNSKKLETTSTGVSVTGDGAFSGNVTVTGNLTVQGTTTTVDSTTINVQNAFVFEGATADDYETTLTVTDPTADRTITLPDATGTVVLADATQTLSNKTIDSASNTLTLDLSEGTLTGTTAEFNTALSDGSFATLAGTETLTNKTISLTNNTLSGTTAEFNSALSDDSFATLTGTETLTNKTLASASFSGVVPGSVTIGSDTSSNSILIRGRSSDDIGTLKFNTNDGSSGLFELSARSTISIINAVNGDLSVRVSGSEVLGHDGTTFDVVGNQTLTGNLIFEGATADAYETTLTVVDPTADRTITLQDGSGTLAFLSDVTGGSTAGSFTTVTIDNNIIFEGATADDFETTLTVTDPTADRTITLPDSTGTVMLNVVEDTSPQLGGTLDANGNDIDMGTNTITDTKVGQWDTAYGWGDHSTQSYLSGTIGFPTDLGAVTGSTTSYLGIGPDLGSIASGDTFVGLAKDFGSMGETVTTTSAQTLSNKTLSSPTFSGTVSGSVAIANTTTDDSLLITTTEDSSSAAPVITLKRNSSSVADADYLGQLKFKGENDADQEIVYAKITGKIQDASDGTEDGIIEFANKKAGSNVITARLRSDSLQLLNGTGLTVAGDTTLSGSLVVAGDLTVQGTTTTVDSTTINVQNAFVFEGATADDFETTLTIVDPTADRTITLPNATGTVALTNSFTHFHSSAQTVTSGEATTNASGTVDYTFSELSGAIHYVAFLNRTLMRASEYSVSGTTLTVNSGVLATDDQIEVTGISV